jgi:arylsulfatase A-like enzyme
MTIAACRRVVLVILDGLRPDAIHAFQLQNLITLQAQGAWTHTARTVWPPVTAAAMGSLLTGVYPPEHGLTSDRFHIPRSREGIEPLPALLRDAGFLTSAFLAQPPLLFRRLARALAERLGVDRPVFAARNAAQICNAAARTLGRQRTGLILVHLPDADDAGHRHGWMSNEYRDGARRLDVAVGMLMALALSAPDTLLIACADHGGGGVVANDHDSDHPLDRTIPIILAGAGVERGVFTGGSIVDIPATILSELGLPQPASYAGRRLDEALQQELVAA